MSENPRVIGSNPVSGKFYFASLQVRRTYRLRVALGEREQPEERCWRRWSDRPCTIPTGSLLVHCLKQLCNSGIQCAELERSQQIIVFKGADFGIGSANQL